MAQQPKQSISYKDAGVDMKTGDRFVQLIRRNVEATHDDRVLHHYGGFAGMFRLDWYEEELLSRHYEKPVLVACTDGVGTKVKIAIAMRELDTIGIDCVAMNVNDLICCGAEPLVFLDYLAVPKLNLESAAQIVKGVAEGCLQAGCALLGGEAAEMPDLYAAGDFDLAGSAIGVVELSKIIQGLNVEPGDHVIALASDGLHSNGFTLARRALLGKGGYGLTDRPPELEGHSVGDEMLRPTRIYVRSVLGVLGRYKVKRVVKALAHITGGGLPENLPRVLPDGLTVRIKRDSWPVPPIFKLIAKKGPVDPIEMMRVFNMGVGFVMIVSPSFANSIMNRLRRSGERCWVLGKVRKGGPELLWA